MNLNPENLTDETSEQQQERERRTGVFGNGKFVECRPFPEDPAIVRTQHRDTCLRRPYAGCDSCPHKVFTLVFDADRNSRFETVACPRWAGRADRVSGRDPESYSATELATCNTKPHEFCPSCPSIKQLVQLGIDKRKPGWYGRWSRWTRPGEEGS